MTNNNQANSAFDEAVKKVLADLKSMPPEVLKAKLAANADGPISRMAEDAEGFAEFLQHSDSPAAVRLRALGEAQDGGVLAQSITDA